MALMYKLYKMQRTFKDGRTDTANGKWYARAVKLGTYDTADLAEIIQRNCSMKHSDVQAVLTELVEVMTDKLQASYAVKINGLGTFKVGMSCRGANNPAEFSATKNVRGTHILFTPSYTVDLATGRRTQALLNGIKVAETPKNAVDVVNQA